MCKYSRHNSGRKPPTFNPNWVYILKVGSKEEIGTPIYGSRLNEIQPNVIYDITPRYSKWMTVGDYLKLQETLQ